MLCYGNQINRSYKQDQSFLTTTIDLLSVAPLHVGMCSFFLFVVIASSCRRTRSSEAGRGTCIWHSAFGIAWYFKVTSTCYEVLCTKHLLIRVASYHQDPSLAALLKKSLSGSLSGILGNTVKNHKPQGEQSLRNLHKVRDYAFEGLSRWLRSQLAPIVASLPHMVKDSFAFRDAVHGIPLTQSTAMYQLDVKDFFLSGDCWDLAYDVASYFVDFPDLRILVGDVCAFLLEHQYVKLDRSSNKMDGIQLKVVKGSGMGLLHSGDVANLSFNARAERALLITKPASIVAYHRFFDDIWLLSHSRSDAHLFIRDLIHHANPFVVKCTAVVGKGKALKHLDVLLDTSADTIYVSPALDKEVIPLSAHSAHTPGVHNSWPGSIVRRARNLASCDSHSHVEALIRKYEMCNASQLSLRLMHKAAAAQVSNTCIQVEEPYGPNPIWFPLGYHPALISVIRHALKSVRAPPDCRVRACWRNVLPNIAALVSNWNRRKFSFLKLKGMVGGSCVCEFRTHIFVYNFF